LVFRGWFYSTDFVDIGVKEVKQYFVSETATKELKDAVAEDVLDRKGPFVYLVPGTSEELPAKDKKALAIADVNLLSEYVSKNFSADEKRC
jgi:hypothetical protein